jgi:hypothetical protein
MLNHAVRRGAAGTVCLHNFLSLLDQLMSKEESAVQCQLTARGLQKRRPQFMSLLFPFVNEIVSIVIGTHTKMAIRNLSSTIFSLWRPVEISRGAGAPCRNSLLGKREEKTEVKGRNPAKGG